MIYRIESGSVPEAVTGRVRFADMRTQVTRSLSPRTDSNF